MVVKTLLEKLLNAGVNIQSRRVSFSDFFSLFSNEDFGGRRSFRNEDDSFQTIATFSFFFFFYKKDFRTGLKGNDLNDLKFLVGFLAGFAILV